MKFNKSTFFAVIITSILLIPSVLQAKEIDLKEAIDWGIQHNYDLEVIKNNIDALERDLAILDTNKAFQVNLGATPIWDFGKGLGDTSLITLTAEKTIADDFNIVYLPYSNFP